VSRRTLLWVALGLGAAIALIGVAGAGTLAACKFTSLDCNLRPDEPELARTSGEIELPAGFEANALATDLDLPTDFDFLPDGSILVTEKKGLLYRIRDGTAPELVLDLRDRLNDAYYRGLMAVAVDPEFESNRSVYVAYTRKRQGAAGDSRAPTHMVVSRLTLDDDGAQDEQVVLGAAGDAAGTCARVAPSADCLPAEIDHIGADIVFADDGTMFVSTGDGGGREVVEKTAFSAQDIDALGGKILRVTRDGQGVPSNPFFNGDPRANRSKVWALGLRNPFRLTLTPGVNVPVVGDVGWDAVDEIDVAPMGSNLGWPCFEGARRTKGYRDTPLCEAMYSGDHKSRVPTLEIAERGTLASVTGGDFVTAGDYPDDYRKYFYADWAQSWIRMLTLDPSSGVPVGAPSEFARAAGGPVSLRAGPDGDLYYLALNFGGLYKIDYAG
jgi:glucose/arabinose dehydrogenase